jgi:acyl carrier protein
MIEQRVIKVVSDALRVKPEKISPQSTIFHDLGAESLDIIDIRFRLEREFGVRISDGEIMESFKGAPADVIEREFSVAHIVDFITAKTANATA